MPFIALADEELEAIREIMAGEIPFLTADGKYAPFDGSLITGVSTASVIDTVEGFSSTDYYSAAAGSMPGSATGFVASAGFRMKAESTTLETLFGTYREFSTLGGFYIGYDGERFKAGAHQDSDGNLITDFLSTGGQAFTEYRGRVVGVLHVITVVVAADGLSFSCYFDGILTRTLSLTGGYRVADVSLQPMIGRSTNPGSPTVATSASVFGVGYAESVPTAQEVLDHYLACVEGDQFADMTIGGGSFDNLYRMGSDASVLNDINGAVNFTQNGTLTAAQYKLRF